MNKIKTWFSIWGILIVFIVITLIGFLFLYIGDDKDFISEIYKALDTASAVALAMLIMNTQKIKKILKNF